MVVLMLCLCYAYVMLVDRKKYGAPSGRERFSGRRGFPAGEVFRQERYPGRRGIPAGGDEAGRVTEQSGESDESVFCPFVQFVAGAQDDVREGGVVAAAGFGEGGVVAAVGFGEGGVVAAAG